MKTKMVNSAFPVFYWIMGKYVSSNVCDGKLKFFSLVTLRLDLILTTAFQGHSFKKCCFNMRNFPWWCDFLWDEEGFWRAVW